MLNLAPLRYAKVLSTEGGPIARLEYSEGDVFGKRLIHAVTYLKAGIVDPEYLSIRATNQPDGAGCHEFAQIACHMAVSEAIERWAVHYSRTVEDPSFAGIGIDGSSNGFAAFPGLLKRQVRPAAFRESIERHCLICWWEGMLSHRDLEDSSPEVSAISIDNPFSKHSVVIIWAKTEFGHSFAFGAGDNEAHASKRALVELSRTQSLLRQLSMLPEPFDAGKRGDVFERRIRYFSSEKGANSFFERTKQQCRSNISKIHLLFDSAVRGPWDAYASVWRTVIESPSQAYLSDREDYFFW